MRVPGMTRPVLEAAPPGDTVTISRHEFDRFERVHSEPRSAQTTIATLNFELVRLKR